MPSIFSSHSSKKGYMEDTLTKKARTSISQFFPGLKRKRSFHSNQNEEEEEEEEEQVVPKKKKLNTMTRLFQKMALLKTNRKKKKNNKKIIVEEEPLWYKCIEFTLPTIECTNGCLGIMKEEESSIFDTKEGHVMTFPRPPFTRCRPRQDSCPARFLSILLDPDSDSDSDTDSGSGSDATSFTDEEDLLTPSVSETNILIDKIQNLNI